MRITKASYLLKHFLTKESHNLYMDLLLIHGFINAVLAGGGSRQTGVEIGEPGFGGMTKTSSPPEGDVEKAYRRTYL
jgi:hypothetical protein